MSPSLPSHQHLVQQMLPLLKLLMKTPGLIGIQAVSMNQPDGGMHTGCECETSLNDGHAYRL